MRVMMFLLVSAVALLLNPAFAKPHHKPAYNLNDIFDLVKKYNTSANMDLFVDDVSHLAEGSGKCEDKFFCKVHEILHKYKKEDIKEILRNLNVFNDSQNYKCEEVLKSVNSTGNSIVMRGLMDHLITCIQYRNLVGAKTSSP